MSQLPGNEPKDEIVPFEHNGVDPRLLETLICPLTRQPLAYDRARNELVSKNARLAYPIRGGIPIMLPEEARDLDEAEEAAEP
ncbi:Trm112 family protein [Hyphomonas sp. NPDC076900]|uniref:Trm112 family protein n=1 Tax=unclassified Hyphomonas TaxID=2630699 RepID=UPI003D04CB6A